MFRQRLLSTDVLPHDSSYSASVSPILPHHPQYRNNVVHASTQISGTMTINSSFLLEKKQEQAWLPISINIDASQLCQTHSSIVVTTLQQYFLPVFPVCNDSGEFYPLLANIPFNNLSTIEERLRRAHYFENKYTNILPNYGVTLRLDLQQCLESYARQWNVHQTILMINLNRLFHLVSRFTLKDYFIKKQEKSYELSMEEWFIVLEFYLQMDVSCFYMKTCTFRNAKPFWDYIGIFSYGKPKAQYGMKQCKDKSCRFCYERLDLTNRFERAMNFSNQQIHRFLNNYQVYLNCDVSCRTSNVIYALTCPCYRYDYIGRCIVPFRDRMAKHRTYGCRLISNFFLGQIVADRLQVDREPDPLIPDCEKKLYAHSTQCSVALQVFLKCHPEYWCLVPMTKEQVQMDDAHITSVERYLLARYQDSFSVTTQTGTYERNKTLVQWCVNHVPSPPSNYQFSLRQKVEQYRFFRKKSDVSVTRFLDLYNAAIVLALPENASDAMRHTIQALLVVFAEPKLVITTSDMDQEIKSNDATDKDYWCQHLLHPRLSQYSNSTNI
ncbi:unnamed protein product [Rotaria sordida]|uniref:Uncharacterized protein n=1 Tax=Rotaria sordida TaxID=392033 RepID=A0A815GX70_9BILA|nr:unnamed protein product [Rotaria sordida]CAF3934818.1 unnamed protein product [Rotaria sordida]